ncbi:MAG: hypothetical protein AAGE59_16375 [Cyanobacteria bacterium P01_F01_bin.86]
MRRFVIILIIALALTSGCAETNSREPSVEPVEAEPNQEEVVPMPNETLSAELQQIVLEAVGAQQNVAPDQLQITSAEAADWPDACLGIAEPDVMCAQMITPGWSITVTDGQQTWQYRTDLDALQVKLDRTQ